MRVRDENLIDRLDRAGSAQLHKRIKARRKHCFHNAVRALQAVPELHDARYVEGVVILPSPFVAIDHGWVETADGTILDPTFAIGKGPHHWPIAYFAGARYSYVEAIDANLANGGLPVWAALLPARDAAHAWLLAQRAG